MSWSNSDCDFPHQYTPGGIVSIGQFDTWQADRRAIAVGLTFKGSQIAIRRSNATYTHTRPQSSRPMDLAPADVGGAIYF